MGQFEEKRTQTNRVSEKTPRFFVNKSGEAFPLEWSTIVSVEGHSFNSAIVVPWSFANVIFHGESKWNSPRKKAFVF